MHASIREFRKIRPTAAHTHTREDESYFVLAGELEVIVGGKTFVLKPGDSLVASRDIPRQLRNSGGIENHYLLIFWPSGFEGFLEATAVPAPDHAVAPTEPPAAAIRNVHQLAGEYGSFRLTHGEVSSTRPIFTLRYDR